MSCQRLTLLICFMILGWLFSGPCLCVAETAGAQVKEESKEEPAKKAQNPVADLISIPLQNNFNFNYGRNNDMQYVGNLQPVIPIHATESWIVISRTIIPFIDQPELSPGLDATHRNRPENAVVFPPAFLEHAH